MNFIHIYIPAFIYIDKLLIVGERQCVCWCGDVMVGGGDRGGGGAGNLWDLQLNLLRHFPVGRAADCG